MNTALLEGKERRKQKEVLAWETWINSQKAPDLLLRAVIKELGWTQLSAHICDGAKGMAAALLLKHACAHNGSVGWLIRPFLGCEYLMGNDPSFATGERCPLGDLRLSRCCHLAQTGAQYPPHHGFCHALLCLMECHLLLTAGHLLLSALATLSGHLLGHCHTGIHPELSWEAGDGSSPGKPMDFTPFKMYSQHVYKPSTCSCCLLLCVFTVPRPKPVKLLAVNVSNNDGFNNTTLNGPWEDSNSTKWPEVMGLQTGDELNKIV